MTPEQGLSEFRKAGALLNGHFILSSGIYSGVFLKKVLAFQYHKRTTRQCKTLATLLRTKVKKRIDASVSPEVGGIVPGYEIARQMGLPAMFVERQDGVFQLRRGFYRDGTMNVLMVEDIVTTGLSSRECIEVIRKTGANVVAVACLIDRSGGKAKVGVPLAALAQFKFPTYDPAKLPSLKDTPAVKPGNRGSA